MDVKIRRVRRILTEKFPDAETELEIFPGAGKVGGYLIWKGFTDLDQLDRQRMVSKALRESLGDDYRSRVSTIFTVTPVEIMAMRED
jgi:hypothetical protein